jgi:UDP-2,3-diacylglucosamine hydrolase
MTTYFISDLHLTPQRPETTDMFFNFLDTEASGAEAVYILGDLFELWIGDDAAEAIGQSSVLTALRQVTDQGVAIYFIHGNRDFLIGREFEQATGCIILPDPMRIKLGDARVILMHGDSMCTDDTEHQQFRKIVNDPAWQSEFLQLPVAKRIELAMDARSRSALHKSMTSMEIMDVNPDTVVREMEALDAEILIHGHTHRPGIHEVAINSRQSTRIVLGDWYTQSSVLRYESGVFQLSALGKNFPAVLAGILNPSPQPSSEGRGS